MRFYNLIYIYNKVIYYTYFFSNNNKRVKIGVITKISNLKRESPLSYYFNSDLIQ